MVILILEERNESKNNISRASPLLSTVALSESRRRMATRFAGGFGRESRGARIPGATGKMGRVKERFGNNCKG